MTPVLIGVVMLFTVVEHVVMDDVDQMAVVGQVGEE